jgi:hypothetical protein
MSPNKLFLLGIIAIASACDAPDTDEAAVTGEDAAHEIVDNLRLAGYPEEEIDVRDDGSVIVGGDALVTLEASREMIGADSHDHDGDDLGFRQYRTTNLISTAVDKICVDGSLLSGTASTALDQALANYTDLGLSFDMVRTSGAAAGCDALITITYWNGTSAEAGFPSGGMPFTSVKLGDDIASTFGLAVTTHVLTHELGHCVGLRHSDYYNRSISCGSGGNEGDADVGAIHIPGTPTTATNNGSVMNACYNAGSTGVWAAADITALTTLYPVSLVPAAPSPLSKHSDACFGYYDMMWTKSTGATHYQLYRSLSSGFSSPTQVYSGTALSTSINVSSGTHYFRARACNSEGCSGWTNQVAAIKLGYCN